MIEFVLAPISLCTSGYCCAARRYQRQLAIAGPRQVFFASTAIFLHGNQSIGLLGGVSCHSLCFLRAFSETELAAWIVQLTLQPLLYCHIAMPINWTYRKVKTHSLDKDGGMQTSPDKQYSNTRFCLHCQAVCSTCVFGLNFLCSLLQTCLLEVAGKRGRC